MKNGKSYISLLILLLLLATAPGAFCETNKFFQTIEDVELLDSARALTEPDSVENTAPAEKRTRSVFFGLTYGNNSSFLGRFQSQVLPYYSADISYKGKTGFWASCVAYGISNTPALMDEIDIMAGWNVDLSKRLDASLYYTHYIFADSSDLLKSVVANTGTAALGYDWGLMYSRINGSYVFGGANDFFIILDNSRYFEFPQVFHKNDYLSVEPKISIISGTQSFVQTHFINQGIPLTISPTTTYGGSGAGTPGGRPASTGSTGSTAETSKTTFNVLSYELSLPVVYTVGKLSFEINGRYSVPVNLLDGDTSAPQFFFSGGILYYISSK